MFSFLANAINDGNDQGNEKDDWDDNDGNDPTENFAVNKIVWIEGKIVRFIKTYKVVWTACKIFCIAFHIW